MFLSNRQHTQLRTLVMDFEVPYRTYIASEIVETYTREGFAHEIANRTPQISVYSSFPKFSSIFGKIKTMPEKIYNLLTNAKTAGQKKIVEDEIEVPFISQLNVLVLVFNDVF